MDKWLASYKLKLEAQQVSCVNRAGSCSAAASCSSPSSTSTVATSTATASSSVIRNTAATAAASSSQCWEIDKSNSNEEDSVTKDVNDKEDSVEIASKKRKFSKTAQSFPKENKKYKFVDSWTNIPKFKGWLVRLPEDRPRISEDNRCFCKVCNVEILCHKSAIEKHSETSKHKNNMIQVSQNVKITEMYKNKSTDEAVKTAELKLCGLLASNNLPFLLIDTLCPLLKNIFPDSSVAKNLMLKRTKATALVSESLGKHFLNDLYSRLRAPGFFFSLVMDETTDISVKKQCALTVTCYNFEKQQTETHFFDLIEAHGSTANDLFLLLKKSLTDKKIPLENLVGFSSDTTNVMAGEHHSLFTLLQEGFPNIVCVKCSCHMAHLAASKACLKLPRHVEDLLRNIGSHFNRSSARRQKLVEFQHFFQVEIHKILSPSNTRWLSVKACVDRVLEQYEPLTGYLRETVFEDPSHTTESMLETITNPFTKVYLEFMSYALDLMTQFNLLFQSEKPLLYRVKPETKILLKTLCSNYIKIDCLRNVDIFKFNHEKPSNFVPLDKIYLGILASESFEQLKKNPKVENKDCDKFLTGVLSFYIELVTNIKCRFTFKDPIYEILELLDPNEAQSFNVKSLVCVVKRFPVLKHFINIQELDNEWRAHALLDFQTLQINTNDPMTYWQKIFYMTNAANMPLFSNLNKAFALLLLLPFSNASVERIFSDLFNIKSDKRNLLTTPNIKALLATKQGIENSGGCVKFEPSKEMLNAKIWEKKK